MPPTSSSSSSAPPAPKSSRCWPSPLLTRFYGPEAFGFPAFFTSIASIIEVIACMRYEMAIMLLKTDEEAANLLDLSLLSVAVATGLMVPTLYFEGDALLSLLGAPWLGSEVVEEDRLMHPLLARFEVISMYRRFGARVR